MSLTKKEIESLSITLKIIEREFKETNLARGIDEAMKFERARSVVFDLVQKYPPKPKKEIPKASPIVELCLTEMRAAIKAFGAYQYSDKGPSEVMDIGLLTDGFRMLTPSAAAKALLELSKVNTNAETLAGCLTGYMQDWDELFDQPEMSELDW